MAHVRRKYHYDIASYNAFKFVVNGSNVKGLSNNLSYYKVLLKDDYGLYYDGYFPTNAKNFVDNPIVFESPFHSLRSLLGLNIPRIASIIGVPSRTWASWESGERLPPHYVERLIIEKLLSCSHS